MRGVIFYLLTVMAEALSIAIRFFITFLVFWLLGQTAAGVIAGALVAGLPVLLSLLGLLGLLSGAGISAWELKARQPTPDEERIVSAALAGIVSPHGSKHQRLLILKSGQARAFTLGRTLYLSASAIESKHLRPMLAHQLGHLAHRDGQLVLALRRLAVPGLSSFVDTSMRAGHTAHAYGELDSAGYSARLAVMVGLFAGGLGTIFFVWLWGPYWVDRELDADLFALRALGDGRGLREWIAEDPGIELPLLFPHYYHRPAPLARARLREIKSAANQLGYLIEERTETL